MVECRAIIGWAEGLHARPAAILARAAAASKIPVTIAKAGGTPVNAASMLGLLSLAADRGDEVVLTSELDGTDEALERLARLVTEGLEELPGTA